MPLPDDPTLPPAERWDARYRDRLAAGPPQLEPHPFLLEQAHRLPERGRALDIACGLGANAIWLAQRGFTLSTVDVSPVACNDLATRAAELRLSLDVICHDLEVEPLPDGPFELIVNARYLQRALAPRIEERLAAGGILIFSTLLEGGSGPPPLHKEYQLRRGELRTLFPHLDLLELREDAPQAERPRASLVARRP